MRNFRVSLSLRSDSLITTAATFVTHRQSLSQLPHYATIATPFTTTPDSSTVPKPTPTCTSHTTTETNEHNDLRNVNVARKTSSGVTPWQNAKPNRDSIAGTRQPTPALGNRTSV